VSDNSLNESYSDVLFINVKGKGYTYNFSRGLLAHSLNLRGLSLEKSYEVAKKVHSILVKEGVTEITEDNLRKYVQAEASIIVDEKIAYAYDIIERWHITLMPIIILISGAEGTGTSSIGKSLANKLAIQQIVSTSVVTQILRKMMAKELAPELHSKSYDAYKKLRQNYSVLYDKVIVGFEEHTRYPAEAIEALVDRGLKEGLSMIIRGEHLVPRFLSLKILNHPNVLSVTLEVKDSEQHLKQYLQDYEEKDHKMRKNQFKEIRKIHDYLVEEAKNRGLIVVQNNSYSDTLDEIYLRVLDKLASLLSFNSKKEENVN